MRKGNSLISFDFPGWANNPTTQGRGSSEERDEGHASSSVFKSPELAGPNLADPFGLTGSKRFRRGGRRDVDASATQAPPDPPDLDERWPCSACTFSNRVPEEVCIVCGAPRPKEEVRRWANKRQKWDDWLAQEKRRKAEARQLKQDSIQDLLDDDDDNDDDDDLLGNDTDDRHSADDADDDDDDDDDKTGYHGEAVVPSLTQSWPTDAINQKLATELLALVLSFSVDSPFALSNLRTVCTAWRQPAECSFLWRPLLLQAWLLDDARAWRPASWARGHTLPTGRALPVLGRPNDDVTGADPHLTAVPTPCMRSVGAPRVRPVAWTCTVCGLIQGNPDSEACEMCGADPPSALLSTQTLQTFSHVAKSSTSTTSTEAAVYESAASDTGPGIGGASPFTRVTSLSHFVELVNMGRDRSNYAHVSDAHALGPHAIASSQGCSESKGGGDAPEDTGVTRQGYAGGKVEAVLGIGSAEEQVLCETPCEGGAIARYLQQDRSYHRRSARTAQFIRELHAADADNGGALMLGSDDADWVKAQEPDQSGCGSDLIGCNESKTVDVTMAQAGGIQRTSRGIGIRGSVNSALTAEGEVVGEVEQPTGVGGVRRTKKKLVVNVATEGCALRVLMALHGQSTDGDCQGASGPRVGISRVGVPQGAARGGPQEGRAGCAASPARCAGSHGCGLDGRAGEAAARKAEREAGGGAAEAMAILQSMNTSKTAHVLRDPWYYFAFKSRTVMQRAARRWGCLEKGWEWLARSLLAPLVRTFGLRSHSDHICGRSGRDEKREGGAETGSSQENTQRRQKKRACHGGLVGGPAGPRRASRADFTKAASPRGNPAQGNPIPTPARDSDYFAQTGGSDESDTVFRMVAKLARRDWVLLYENLRLLFMLVCEAASLDLAHVLSQRRRGSAHDGSAPAGEENTHRGVAEIVLDLWKMYDKWLGSVDMYSEALNDRVAQERQAVHVNCSSILTPYIRGQAILVFRDTAVCHHRLLPQLSVMLRHLCRTSHTAREDGGARDSTGADGSALQAGDSSHVENGPGTGAGVEDPEVSGRVLGSACSGNGGGVGGGFGGICGGGGGGGGGGARTFVDPQLYFTENEILQSERIFDLCGGRTPGGRRGERSRSQEPRCLWNNCNKVAGLDGVCPRHAVVVQQHWKPVAERDRRVRRVSQQNQDIRDVQVRDTLAEKRRPPFPACSLHHTPEPAVDGGMSMPCANEGATELKSSHHAAPGAPSTNQLISNYGGTQGGLLVRLLEWAEELDVPDDPSSSSASRSDSLRRYFILPLRVAVNALPLGTNHPDIRLSEETRSYGLSAVSATLRLEPGTNDQEDGSCGGPSGYPPSRRRRISRDRSEAYPKPFTGSHASYNGCLQFFK